MHENSLTIIIIDDNAFEATRTLEWPEPDRCFSRMIKKCRCVFRPKSSPTQTRPSKSGRRLRAFPQHSI